MQPRQFNQYRFRRSEPKEIKNAIDISKYVPIITAALILFGVSKLIFYYDRFGVTIISYLDFGEIITSFLDIIIVVVFVLIGSTFQFAFTPDIKGQSEGNRRPTSSMVIFVIGFLVLIAIGSYVFVFVFKEIFSSNENLKTALTIASLAGFLLYVMNMMVKGKKTRLQKVYILIMLAAFSSEMLIALVAENEYRAVKYHQKYLGTKIVFKNETIMKDSSHTFVSDSSNFYIGKTNNYIFIHHAKEHKTNIYPISSVVEIEVNTKAD